MRPKSTQRKIREGIILPHEDKGIVHLAARAVLKMTGCWSRACEHARKINVARVEFDFANLPESFDGVKVLFLSDLHFPGFAGFSDTVEELLSPLEFDYCFLGGDYSNGTGALPQMVNPCLERLMSQLRTKTRGIYAILGNHDIYDTAVLLEKNGAKVLLNDNCLIERGDGRIRLVGLDDHFHFRNTDWELAEENIGNERCFKILLSHSPDNYRKAAAKGYDLMLSGHTHGGQLCLPPGIPIITHSKVRGKFARGLWNYEQLKGFTSCGTGTSAIGARLYAPPEVCMLTLRP